MVSRLERFHCIRIERFQDILMVPMYCLIITIIFERLNYIQLPDIRFPEPSALPGTMNTICALHTLQNTSADSVYLRR